jgi:serpin B
MRRLPIPGILLVLILSVSAPSVSAPAHSSPKVTSDLSALVAGNTAFALDLYHTLHEPDANLFISPFSISSALAMAYAGARNETSRQMESTLRFPFPDMRLHEAFKSLNARIGFDPDRGIGAGENDFRLLISNSLWGQEGHRFLDGYLDLLKKSYGTELRKVDFIRNSGEARKAVNDWVSGKTEGKIPEILPSGGISPQTRLVLVNAVYFRNAWRKTFFRESTREEPFTLVDGRRITVPMMKKIDMFSYAEGNDFQAVEIPYRFGKTSMVVLLPKPGRFASFERSLDSPRLASILTELGKHSSEIALQLPRFRIAPQPFSLRNVLETLGIRQAFSAGADFSGMDGQKGLFVSDVFHRTFIRVDESGTEAAASTAVAVARGIPNIQVEFTADRPFIFLIRDGNTGTILFLGRVMNPKSV